MVRCGVIPRDQSGRDGVARQSGGDENEGEREAHDQNAGPDHGAPGPAV